MICWSFGSCHPEKSSEAGRRLLPLSPQVPRTTRLRFGVPKVGLEPTHPCGYQILSLARLPFRHFGFPCPIEKPEQGWPLGEVPSADPSGGTL